MAKEVKEERLALVVELTREDGTGPVEVKVRGDYHIESDGIEAHRSIEEVTITPAQESAIKSFGANVLQQIKDAEAIS
tara:strand:- start:1804 stop:2037 length:234 start_codon:yes stop_codon:yes gene_type:complete